MSTPQQKVYVFISGKNWKLSLAELSAYFDARKCPFEVSEFSPSFFRLQTKDPPGPTIIDELGGTLKIAEVTCCVPNELVIRTLSKESKAFKAKLKTTLCLDSFAEKIPSARSGKTIFGVSAYWANPAFRSLANATHRFLGSALKEELKDQGRKARFMGFPRGRECPQLTAVEVLKKGLVENRAEILVCVGRNETSVGSTVAVHNPFEFQKRDVEKPMQRKIFAISPRLARIMINLAGCTPGKILLDPFCGVGTILQEALISKVRVIGLDINRWCVEAAKRNLAWLKQEYSLENVEYSVLQGDARRLRSKTRDEVDCIATEPDLGPALRDMPTISYAERIISKLTPLFSDFLREAHAVLSVGGRLVIVTPYIKTRSGGPVTMPVSDLASRVGLETVKPFEGVHFGDFEAASPLRDLQLLIEVEERHLIGRSIHIFQKSK